MRVRIKLNWNLSNARSFSSVSSPDRLKIAFFGSDRFSTASLTALHAYSQLHNHTIHVITPTLKPTGRGLTQLIDLPLGTLANSLSLPVHRVENSSDMNELVSHQFNLAIAVSFGKLIPSKFLQSCEFGGLNVHPSLLPTYSGASPLQYALLNDDKFTGCTVQTLHPTKFDKGEILLQSSKVDISDSDNFESLEKKLGDIGAKLLVETIEQRLFLDGGGIQSEYPFSLASKIPRSRKQVHCTNTTARQIKRMEDALGSVYTFIHVNLKRKGKQVVGTHRVILTGISEYFDEVVLQHPGQFILGPDDSLIIKTIDGYIKAKTVQQQAKVKQTPQQFMSSFHKNIGDSPHQFIDQ